MPKSSVPESRKCRENALEPRKGTIRWNQRKGPLGKRGNVEREMEWEKWVDHYAFLYY